MSDGTDAFGSLPAGSGARAARSIAFGRRGGELAELIPACSSWRPFSETENGCGHKLLSLSVAVI